MHATTKQLLSLRDREPVTADVQQHLMACEECQQQLQSMATLQSALQELSTSDIAGAPLPAFAAKWQSVQQGYRAKQADTKRRRHIRHIAIAASVVIFVVAAIPFINVTSPGGDSGAVASVDNSQDRVQELMQRNAQLEDALRELPQSPRVVRGGTAYAIASFEDQIALVDYELSYGQHSELDSARSVNLLQNRAELLDSLYTVRYSEAMASLAGYSY